MSSEASKKLLIVEDDPDQLSIRALLFEHRGYECFTAGTAGMAIALAGKERVPCVVMDLNLPKAADGLSVIRTLLGFHPAPKIVVLTGINDTGLERAPELHHVAAIFQKGGPIGNLLKAVEQICAAPA